MKIALIVEGRTESVFVPHLRRFLRGRLDQMPLIDPFSGDGRLPTGDQLRRVVDKLLSGFNRADHVVALTDVYTGSIPSEFRDAAEAKSKMSQWVGGEGRFHPHAAQHDFEAWLLPYWTTIQSLAQHNRACPSGNPELVNHNNPPAYWIKEIFRTGQSERSYVKPRDAGRILEGKDLLISIEQCSELKSFVNTFLRVSGGTIIP